MAENERGRNILSRATVHEKVDRPPNVYIMYAVNFVGIRIEYRNLCRIPEKVYLCVVR